jgi:hypothetical protein
MSEKINKAIEVTYQAAGAATGLTDVQMDVYDEAHAIDAAKGGAMTEIGSTGRYYKQFTPDAEGEWTVMIDSTTAPGKVVKHYTVVSHDVDSVGDAIAAQNDISTSDVASELTTYDAATGAEVATVAGKIDALNDIAASDVTGGTTVSSAESNIRGGSETLETIKTAIDAIATVALPMVG